MGDRITVGGVAIEEHPFGGIWIRRTPGGWDFRAYRAPDGTCEAGVTGPDGRFEARERDLAGLAEVAEVFGAFRDYL